MTQPAGITPADIEAKFRDIQGQVDVVAEDSKKSAVVGRHDHRHLDSSHRLRVRPFERANESLRSRNPPSLMLQRLILMAIRGYIRGPAKSWLFTTIAAFAMRRLSKSLGRRPVVETLSVKPGQQFLVEGLTVSLKSQIKDEKRVKRDQRRSRRAERKAAKAS